jgi:hypothetical protein
MDGAAEIARRNGGATVFGRDAEAEKKLLGDEVVEVVFEREVFGDDDHVLAVLAEFEGLVEDARERTSVEDVHGDGKDGASGFDGGEMAMKGVVLPFDVDKADTLAAANIAEVGVTGAWKPTETASDVEDAAAMGNELEDHGVGTVREFAENVSLRGGSFGGASFEV